MTSDTGKAHDHGGPRATTDAKITVGILTCSDRGARGERADVSGPTLHNLVLDRLAGHVRQYRVVPDEREAIEATIREWADDHHLDLILTTGGTGLSARDVTPDATRAACEREVPALGFAMAIAALQITPYAMLTRATAGIRGRTLVINLPGNPKALTENFGTVAEVIPHAIDIIRGVDTHAGGKANTHRDHRGHGLSVPDNGRPAVASPIAQDVGGPPC